MVKRMRIAMIVLLGLFTAMQADGQTQGVAPASMVLFDGGRSDYSIVLAADASVSEQTAAKELQQCLLQISGAVFPILTGNDHLQTAADSKDGAARHYIYVGWNEACGSPRPDAADEGYTYRTVQSQQSEHGHPRSHLCDLHIFGGSEHGTMYGVFAFLERELGVRWYTASYTLLPHLDKCLLPHLEHSEHPVLRQRLDFTYEALRNYKWAAHNLLNNMNRLVKTSFGTFSAFWGMHTFERLMPASEYFDVHPEYFSLLKGKRSDRAQLCLSNDDMRRELTENLKTVIRENPGYWCYDVSQNDNNNNCECEECMKLVEWYGGRTGALLWFVNQVANDIALEFPDVYIGTFAYRTTRQAPRLGSITPAANVVIRLCDIECCMAHPIAGCEENRSFLDDLNGWLHATPNVYIWDYANSFYHYLLPFPDYRALAANYQLFAEAGAIGVMEEGAHDALWSEFSELKQWMVARLLWNPYQDTDSLAALFIADYYGVAAPFVQRYFDLCQSRAQEHHLTLKVMPDSPIYGEGFVAEAQRLVDDALAAAAADGEILRRTKRVAAQIYYLRLRRDPRQALEDGTVRKLKDIFAADSTIVRENGFTLQTVLDELGVNVAK